MKKIIVFVDGGYDGSGFEAPRLSVVLAERFGTHHPEDLRDNEEFVALVEALVGTQNEHLLWGWAPATVRSDYEAYVVEIPDEYDYRILFNNGFEEVELTLKEQTVRELFSAGDEEALVGYLRRVGEKVHSMQEHEDGLFWRHPIEDDEAGY